MRDEGLGRPEISGIVTSSTSSSSSGPRSSSKASSNSWLSVGCDVCVVSKGKPVSEGRPASEE